MNGNWYATKNSKLYPIFINPLDLYSHLGTSQNRTAQNIEDPTTEEKNPFQEGNNPLP
jgi:hypothetical protein